MKHFNIIFLSILLLVSSASAKDYSSYKGSYNNYQGSYRKPVQTTTPTGITKEVAKELKHTGYTAKPTTYQQAQQNHDDNWKNCIQYALTIKEIATKNGLKARIYQTGGLHAIVEVDEKGKTITYSNGKVVNGSAYTKIKELK